MKKIIGIVIASLVFCNIGFAEVRVIENTRMKLGAVAPKYITVVCVDGYKFIVARTGVGSGLVQAHEEKNGKSLPTKC